MLPGIESRVALSSTTIRQGSIKKTSKVHWAASVELCDIYSSNPITATYCSSNANM